MSRKIFRSIAAVTSLVLLSSTTAFAVGDYDWSSITVDDITVYPHDNYLLPDEMDFRTDIESSLGDALDDNEFAIWNDDNEDLMPHQRIRCNNPMIDAPDDSLDSVITCDAYPLLNIGDTPTGLEATPQLRVWSDKALTRYVVTLENTTEESIEYSWEWFIDFGSGDARHATSSEFPYLSDSDEYTLNETDLVDEGAHWSMSPGAPNESMMSDLPSTIAWGDVAGGLGAEFIYVNSDEVYIWNDNENDGEQLTLAAGESVSFAVFNYAANMTDFYDTEDLTDEVPRANFDAAMEYLFASSTAVFGGSGSGLIAPETAVPCDDLFVGVNASDIANWDCGYSNLGSTPAAAPAATTTPKLATTGANVEWLMVAGLLAVIAGAGFLTLSRRKRTA
jgi:LPXTG-motif cell wall-anchored protein